MLVVSAILAGGQEAAPTRAFAGMGAAGARFLEEDFGARSFALGGAFAAVADGAALLGANPGGLDALVYPEVTATYRKGLLDTSYQSLGYAHPLRRGWALGAAVRRYDGGSIDVNYLDGRQETLKAEEDWAASLMVGRALGERVSLGVGGKVIRSTLAGQYTATAFAGDLGILVRTLDERVGVGLAVLDAGTGLTYKSATEPLPTRVRAGLAYRPLPALMLAGDVVQPFRGATSVHLGTELGVVGGRPGGRPYATVRAGVNRTGEDLRFSAGFGLGMGAGILDYGFGQGGPQAFLHQVSLSWRLGSWTPFDVASRYYEKGQPRRAMAVWARVPRGDQPYAAAQERLAAVAEELDRPRRARVRQEVEALSVAAGRHMQAKAWAKAGEIYAHVMVLDPSNAVAKGGLAKAREERRKEEARLAEAAALAAQARPHVERKAWAQAEDLYRRALALDPGNAAARDGLVRVKSEQTAASGVEKALALKEQGKLAEALGVCAETLRAVPGREEVILIRDGIVSRLLELARAAVKDGQYEKADEACVAILTHVPGHAEAGEVQGRARAALGEQKDWKECLRLVEARDLEAAAGALRKYRDRVLPGPHADEALYRLGMVAKERKELKEAVQRWEAVVDQYPDSPWAKEADKQIADLTGKSRLAERKARQKQEESTPPAAPKTPSKIGQTEELWK